ncbi:MAG: hypothetical protein E6152_18380 [Escherichia coli]|nr:hypothetical protein [Escherichia coli]
MHSWQALCHILRDLHSGVQLPGISLSAAVALLERRSQAIHAPALDRGAAHGALMRLEHPNASAEAALTMLAQLSPAQSGEALHGLLALARHQLACQPTFIAGFSSHLNQLSDADFINALPDLRAAMAWLPLSTGATSRFGAANAVALSTTGHCTSSTTRTAGTGIAAKLGSFPCLN